MKKTKKVKLEIKDIIKNARRIAGMCQDELALQLGYRSGQAVSNWERGVLVPPLRHIDQLVTLLKIDKELFNTLLKDKKVRDYQGRLDSRFGDPFTAA